jgi:hypothetical protein
LLLLQLRFIRDVAEDIVQDEVSVSLLRENECLHKFLVRLSLIRDLANDLNNNILIRALRIDIGHANLAVMEIKLLDAIVDSLKDQFTY